MRLFLLLCLCFAALERREAKKFKKYNLRKNPRSIKYLSANQFSRSGAVLNCDSTFYQGYRLRSGDYGDIVFSPGTFVNMCIYKFFPETCRISFFCSEFSVSPGFTSATCPRKVITKVGKAGGVRWCGDRTPPTQSAPLISDKPLLVGYVNLAKSQSSSSSSFLNLLSSFSSSSDKFICRVSCSGGGVAPSPTPSPPSPILNCNCGIVPFKSRSWNFRSFSPFSDNSALSRIIGGTIAPEGSVPWQSSLAVSGPNIFCGGTLVTDRHVITAAHCLAGVDSSTLNIVDIIFNLYNTKDGSKSLVRKILKVEINDGFDKDTLQNDIAIITLKSPVDITKGTIVPICLPGSNTDPAVGSSATVTGFGTTSTTSEDASPNLLTVNVNILLNTQCKQSNSLYTDRITDTMLCAGVPQGGKDACKRDSGGPLVSVYGTRSTLVGIVSWGQGCAEAQFPGVYTRVSRFAEWIQSRIQTGFRCS